MSMHSYDRGMGSNTAGRLLFGFRRALSCRPTAARRVDIMAFLAPCVPAHSRQSYHGDSLTAALPVPQHRFQPVLATAIHRP